MKISSIFARATACLSLIMFIMLISGSTANAQLANWRGELPVVIHNNSGSAMTNCQVPMVFSTAQLINLGLMLSNGNDIRFGNNCGGSNLYNYWIEGYMNTDTTKIWVMVPSVNANDSVKIFLFCGNPSATAASTLSTFNGPWSSTDSVVVASTNTVSLCQRGFRFTANEKVLVTHFGKRIPNATQRYVTLFDFNSQAIIAQIQVDAGTLGIYNYNPLTTPLWLNSGQQYVLELFNGSGDMYYYGTSSQISPAFTYGDMRYCNSCTQNTFPTTVLTNYHYGVPDLLYYRINTVTPAPTATLGLPADTNTPAAPANLIGVAGNQQAQLRWSRNAEFDMAKYYVYRNTTNNPGSASLIDSVNHPDTTYLATGLNNGTGYYFWVRAVDRFCVPRLSPFSNFALVTPSAIAHLGDAIPKVFALHQNYPNPFNPSTTIKFDMPKGGIVRLTVYDLLGREVETLVSEYLAAGYHEATFVADKLASGVYFYKIEAGTFSDRKKMVLVK